MRTRIRLSFAHHMSPELLRTLGFDWQAINLLLRKAISTFTVWPNHQWSVLILDKLRYIFNKIKAAYGDRVILKEEITI